MMNDLDIAWAAGFFDGEGSIDMPASAGQSGRLTYKLRAAVTQKDRESLLDFQRIVGCGTVSSKQTVSGCYCWTAMCRKAEESLRLLLPFLRVKRKRALIGLELCPLQRKFGDRRTPLSDHEVALRKDIQRRLRIENGYYTRRGTRGKVYKTPPPKGELTLAFLDLAIRK